MSDDREDKYDRSVSEIWKSVALILSGALISLCVAWITVTKDAIGRTEVAAQNQELQKEVAVLQVQVARISEHLGIHAP